jgi:hypothetical protein
MNAPAMSEPVISVPAAPNAVVRLNWILPLSICLSIFEQ